MALKKLVYGDGYDGVSIGSISFDDSNDYTIYTNGGDDDITFYIDGTVYVRAGTGNDRIYAGGSGTGSVYGDDGNDYIKHMPNSFDDGVLKLYGGAGDDYIFGIGGQADRLYGEAGNDQLDVRSGNVAFGGDGNDIYDIVEGAKVVEYAGGGIDTIRANYTSFNFANFPNFERFQFVGNSSSFQNVTVKGDANANWAETGTGADTLWMGGGNDTADGSYGNDKLYGEAGNDLLKGGDGNDYLAGGDGNDILDGGIGTNSLVGGAGNDLYRSADGVAVGGIVEQLGGGIDTLETAVSVTALAANVENLKVVGAGNSTAVSAKGNELANVITGHQGNNTLSGLDGADTIYGNGGNDGLYGDAGNDRLYGGDGNDLVKGGTGDDELAGNSGNDFMTGDAGSDKLYGGEGNDTLHGGDGYDTINGEKGDDYIHGGGLTDVLDGGEGNDYLWGDGGDDRLTGGAGNDKFVFVTLSDSVIGSGIDKIMDFAKGADQIDVSSIDANALVAGNQAFTWTGMELPEVAKAGNMWGEFFAATTYNPSFVRVYGDVNGDGTADMQIDVLGVTTLSAEAFIL